MSATLAASAVQYRVQSDLNRESLPQSNRDPQRKVWWMNAISAAVLGIGLTLTKEPAEYAFHPVVVEPPMQVEVFVPQQQQVQQPEEVPDDQPVEEVELSAIQPVVVAADPSKVAFAVEVKGPTVASSDLRKVAPPPAIIQRPKEAPPSGPVLFKRGGEGYYPSPQSYPADAQRRGEEGEGMMYVAVSEDGSPTEVTVYKSTGSASLDRAMREQIRRFWRWPTGGKREFHVPYEFKLSK